MNSNLGKQKFFVIYQITNLINGKIYVGAHITYNVNDKYMGSSKYLKKDMKEFGRQNFEKIPIHIFDNKDDMKNKEAEIVTRKFCHREDTYNRMVGGITEFTWVNMITVKDKEGNTSKVYCDDPRYLSGELIPFSKGVLNSKISVFNKGKTNVKDINGRVFKINTNDPKYISGEYISISKGKIQKQLDWTNKKHSENTKKKMSKKASEKIGSKSSQFGTCWITKDNENKKIKKENLDEWINQDWIKGRRVH